MKLINASNNDVGKIVELIQEMATGFGATSPISDAYVKDYLKTERSHILLAVDKDSIVAMASYSIRPCLFHAGDAWYIEEVIVTESQRGKGIGTLLINEIVKKAKHNKCLELSIAVDMNNQGAHRLYQNMGFASDSILLEQHFL